MLPNCDEKEEQVLCLNESVAATSHLHPPPISQLLWQGVWEGGGLGRVFSTGSVETGGRHGSPQSPVPNSNTFICRVKAAYTSVSALSLIFCRVRLKISRLRCFLSGQVLSFRRPALLPRRAAPPCAVWRRPPRSLTPTKQPRERIAVLHPHACPPFPCLPEEKMDPWHFDPCVTPGLCCRHARPQNCRVLLGHEQRPCDL